MRIRFCAALVLALSARATAAELLSWDQAVKEAARNNADLRSAVESLRSASSNRNAAVSNFLPELSAGAGVDKSADNAALTEGESKDYSVSVTARQNLFNGLADTADFRRRAANVDVALSELAATRADVGYRLRTAFATLLFAQDQVSLAEKIAARRRENVRLVNLRYEAGREHKGSYLRSRAAFGQAEFDVSRARRALRVAQRDLSAVLGRDAFDVLAATGTLSITAPEQAPDFPALTASVPANLAAEARARAAAAGVGVARGALLPALSASGSLSRRGPEWPPRDDRWSVGASVSFPFDLGGRTIFELRSAAADSRAARAGADQARRDTAAALEDAFAAYQDGVQRTRVQRDFLEAAETRAEIARSQYTSGLISFDDWDIIENDLISNQTSMLSSLLSAVFAEAEWERTVGKDPFHEI